jgi:CheY-like chemotaxis protein
MNGMTQETNVVSFPDEEKSAAREAMDRKGSARSATGPSVLIVEDDERFGRMLGDALKNKELAARHVTTAEAAYELIRSAPPGTYPVIMLDNHLGKGMYGIDLMYKLSDEELLEESHIVKVVWTSTDTEVEGLWRFPRHLHNVEHGSNDTSVEELAWMASQFMPTRIVEQPSVAACAY